MLVIFSVLAATTLLSAPTGDTNVVLRSAAEIELLRKTPAAVSFDITGTVYHADLSRMLLEDQSGRAWIALSKKHGQNQVGDRVHVRGPVWVSSVGEVTPYAATIERLGAAQLRPPLALKLGDIDFRRHHLATITTSGTVMEERDDEQDPNYRLLLIKDGATVLPASLRIAEFPQTHFPQGAKVRVTGIYQKAIRGIRRYSGPFVEVLSADITAPPPDDPFDVPYLEKLWYMAPIEVAALDCRKVSGEVLCVWGGNRLLVREHGGRIVKVSLQQGEKPPASGISVDVVGYPQTNIFRLNLSNAHWRTASSADASPAEEPAVDIKAEYILQDFPDHRVVSEERHGQLVRLRGIVRSLPAAEVVERRLYLDSDAFKVPVDVSACPAAADGIEIGSVVEVTGRCLIETSDWSPNEIFPQATGFAVIARSPADFTVISRPPWWTPARFAAVLTALLGIIGAVLLWNLSLQVLVKRKARQLFKSEIAQASSELRVGERTRLAVELHDTLVQNLTGVSMELEAANGRRDDTPTDVREHISVAVKALNSCRTELRNCLWDLRSQALEEPTLTRAIERTLQPLAKSAKIAVRFDVHRAHLSDNTTHAILRIVRELVGNAIRHGRATTVKVAGAEDAAALRCAVTDNGSGFDPETAPGVLQGHFGLQGIRERIQLLDGTLTIESSPGKGTRAVFTLPKPQS